MYTSILSVHVQATLKNGVEKYLRAVVDPELEVINATGQQF